MLINSKLINKYSYSQLLQDIKYLNYTRDSLFKEKEYFRQICYWLDISNDKNVADLGCGTGAITNKLYNEYPHISFIGFDKDPFYIKHAQNINRYISYQLTDLSKGIPIVDDKFDTCFSFAAFHQIRNYEYTLKECYRVLKKSAKIVLFIPIDECPQSKQYDEYYPGQSTIDDFEKVLFKEYYNIVNTFVSSNLGLSWQEAPTILKKLGFCDIDIKGMFTPYFPDNAYDYVDLIYELWIDRADFVYKNFSNTNNLNNFNVLKKEYDKKYIYLKNNVHSDNSIYVWGGAPILIVKGKKQ